MGKSLEKVHRPWAGMGLSLHLGGTSLPPSTGCLAPLHPQAGSPDTSHFFLNYRDVMPSTYGVPGTLWVLGPIHRPLHHGAYIAQRGRWRSKQTVQ